MPITSSRSNTAVIYIFSCTSYLAHLRLYLSLRRGQRKVDDHWVTTIYRSLVWLGPYMIWSGLPPSLPRPSMSVSLRHPLCQWAALLGRSRRPPIANSHLNAIIYRRDAPKHHVVACCRHNSSLVCDVPDFQPSAIELFTSPLNFGGCGTLCPCRTSRRRRHWLLLGNASTLISSVVPFRNLLQLPRSGFVISDTIVDLFFYF